MVVRQQYTTRYWKCPCFNIFLRTLCSKCEGVANGNPRRKWFDMKLSTGFRPTGAWKSGMLIRWL